MHLAYASHNDDAPNPGTLSCPLSALGNYVQAILTALHDTDEPKSQPAHDGNGTDLA